MLYFCVALYLLFIFNARISGVLSLLSKNAEIIPAKPAQDNACEGRSFIHIW
jgi:hypothetical protein